MILEADAALGVVTLEADANFPSSLKGNLQAEAQWGEVRSGAGRRKASVTLFGCFYCVLSSRVESLRFQQLVSF